MRHLPWYMGCRRLRKLFELGPLVLDPLADDTATTAGVVAETAAGVDHLNTHRL